MQYIHLLQHKFDHFTARIDSHTKNVKKNDIHSALYSVSLISRHLGGGKTMWCNPLSRLYHWSRKHHPNVPKPKTKPPNITHGKIESKHVPNFDLIYVKEHFSSSFFFFLNITPRLQLSSSFPTPALLAP